MINKIEYFRMKDLPNISGVYAIFNDNNCLYVGSSVVIRNRIVHHNKRSSFLENSASYIIWFVEEKLEKLASLENEKIKLFKPTLNCVGNRSDKIKKPSHFGKHELQKQGVTTLLRDTTLKLLQNRSSQINLKEISEKSSLPLFWLKSFYTGKCADPGVNRVQALYEYITGEKLVLITIEEYRNKINNGLIQN